jgi:Arc/MetJ-type ribon-helix-helix transcriptional regulator
MDVRLDEASTEIVQRELERGAFATAEDAVAAGLKLLELHAMDDWLLRNREYVQAALEESFAAAERGESYSPEESRALLEQHRALRKAKAA